MTSTAELFSDYPKVQKGLLFGKRAFVSRKGVNLLLMWGTPIFAWTGMTVNALINIHKRLSYVCY